MTRTTAEQIETARCPRCGYDQRGELARWTDRCPLFSRCSECGLTIDWRELLDPRRVMPAWCVEYAGGFFPFIRRVVLTALLAHRPLRFWTQLRMTHPIRRGRLLLYFLIFVLLAYGSFALCQGAFAWSEWSFLRTTRWAAGLTAADRNRAVLHAIVFPLSTESPNASPPGWTAPRSPFEPPVTYLHNWRGVVPAMIFLIVASVAGPLTFLALPESRRRAKVRWRHVLRIGLYGFTFSAFALVGLSLLTAGELAPDALVLSLCTTSLIGIYAVAFVVLFPLWWFAAIKRYLRMEHAPAVMLSVLAVAYLAGFAVAFNAHVAMNIRWFGG